MKTFTDETIGQAREEKARQLLFQKKEPTFVHAICHVLRDEFGVVYGCYGGTPVMPICEYRPLPNIHIDSRSENAS